MSRSSDRAPAEKYGTTVEELREVEDRLRAMPMEAFLSAVFKPGEVVYDAHADLWIAADRQYSGPGFGFMAIRRDKSFFTGVIPPQALQ